MKDAKPVCLACMEGPQGKSSVQQRVPTPRRSLHVLQTLPSHKMYIFALHIANIAIENNVYTLYIGDFYCTDCALQSKKVLVSSAKETISVHCWQKGGSSDLSYNKSGLS